MGASKRSRKAMMSLVQESETALTRMNRELVVMVVLQECLHKAAAEEVPDSKVEDREVVNSAVAASMAEVAMVMAMVATSMAVVAASMEEIMVISMMSLVKL